ncbi:MAG TPA: class E sortase [Pseudonocardiaceae bacterium]|nr:class E sortase [Pseudonocardiaceae bacterium]
MVGPGLAAGVGATSARAKEQVQGDEAPTELIEAVGGRRQRAAGGGGDRTQKVVFTVGEVLITLGLVVLLFVVYEVYVTDWMSAGKQADATANLDERWSQEPLPDPGNQRTEKVRPVDGEGFAKLYIPAFGTDFVFTVLEGTTETTLEAGPGHYNDTALPGEPGNFAVAGHRVGKGAPFNDLDLLRSCDAIVIETQTDWYIYRVMPMEGEAQDWEQGRGASEQCTDVKPLGEPYEDLVGQQIVLPHQSEVIAPVPNHPDRVAPPERQAALITLTTCHPRFSAKQRLIVHGVFTKQYPKDPANPGAQPPELTEG